MVDAQPTSRVFLKKLAFKWCKDYGDATHRKNHHEPGGSHDNIYSMFCGNCRDGLNFAEDVLITSMGRLHE